MTSVQPYPTDQLDPLTEEQRDRFLELVKDPDVGHVKAAREIGIAGSRGQIRRMLADDPEVQAGLAEAWRETLRSRRLAITDLLDRLAYIVHDDGNASQLRAIQDGLAYHGIHAKQVTQLEVTGGVTVERREVSLQGVLHILADAGALDTRLVDALAASRPVLPAHTD